MRGSFLCKLCLKKELKKTKHYSSDKGLKTFLYNLNQISPSQKTNKCIQLV